MAQPKTGASAVLVPVFTDEFSDQSLGIAVDLAQHAGGTLIVHGLESVARQTPLYNPDLIEETQKRGLAYAARAKNLGAPSVNVLDTNLIGHDIATMILEEVDRRDIFYLVLERPEEMSTSISVFRNAFRTVFESGKCNVILVTGQEYLDTLNSILVPIAGGPHSGLAVDIAHAMATQHDAWIELFHVVGPDADADDRQAADWYVEAATNRLGGFENVDTWVYEDSDVSEAITEQSQYYDMTILGAPRKGRLRQFIFGSTPETVRDHAESTVVTVHSKHHERPWYQRWLGRGT